MKSFAAFTLAAVLLACGGASAPPGAPTVDKGDAGSITEGAPSPAPSSGSAVVCTDKDGKTHKPGETWNDGCNNCNCGEKGTAGCTRRACN